MKAPARTCPDLPTYDEAPWAEVLSAYRPLLLRRARPWTCGFADAEDLVQDTLLKACRAFPRLRPHSSLRAWLLTILRHTAVSAWRRRALEQRGLHQLGLLAQESRPPGELDPPAALAAAATAAQVKQALAEIPTTYRRCIELVDLQRLSYREAARATGWPVGTVQSRLFRGRRLLRARLWSYAQEQGYLPSGAHPPSGGESPCSPEHTNRP